MSGDFPDTEGGNKCGRLSAQEEEKLSDDDPVKLRSRTAVCNQVLYCVISGDFVKANKEPVKIEKSPSSRLLQEVRVRADEEFY